MDVGKRAGKKLLESIENAEHTIKIVSPFLSASTIERNLVPAKNRGLKVTIVTRESEKNWNGNVLELLKDFESFRSDDLHAKFYIIDDKIMYEGSANFTYTGLFKGIEQMSYTTDEYRISEAIKNFDQIKKNCKHFEAETSGDLEQETTAEQAEYETGSEPDEQRDIEEKNSLPLTLVILAVVVIFGIMVISQGSDQPEATLLSNQDIRKSNDDAITGMAISEPVKGSSSTHTKDTDNIHITENEAREILETHLNLNNEMSCFKEKLNQLVNSKDKYINSLAKIAGAYLTDNKYLEYQRTIEKVNRVQDGYLLSVRTTKTSRAEGNEGLTLDQISSNERQYKVLMNQNVLVMDGSEMEEYEQDLLEVMEKFCDERHLLKKDDPNGKQDCYQAYETVLEEISSCSRQNVR